MITSKDDTIGIAPINFICPKQVTHSERWGWLAFKIYRKETDNIKELKMINGIRPEVKISFHQNGKTAEEIMLALIVKEAEKLRNDAVFSSNESENLV